MVRRQESPMVQVVRHQESPIGSHGETPGITERFKLQVRLHNLTPPSSLGSGWHEIHCPPAVEARHQESPQVHMVRHQESPIGSGGETPGITSGFIEVLHLFRWYTHTPAHTERVTLDEG